MRTDAPRRYPVYVPRATRTWWLRPGPFMRFAAREFTAVFAAAWSIVMLLLLSALSRGPEAYEDFLRLMRSPWMVAFSAVTLVAMIYHALTWFRLTSHIMLVRLGRKVVPRDAVVGSLVVVWVVASAIVAYLHVWF